MLWLSVRWPRPWRRAPRSSSMSWAGGWPVSSVSQD